jgi:hypothetical protein
MLIILCRNEESTLNTIKVIDKEVISGMTDKERTKEMIILFSVFFVGSALYFIFSEHIKYAVSIFICFPLGLYFLLRKTASFSFASPLNLIERLIFALILIGMGVYGILRINNIVP